LSASEAPDPGRHHVGTPGDIISECPGDFVGIRNDMRKIEVSGTIAALIPVGRSFGCAQRSPYSKHAQEHSHGSFLGSPIGDAALMPARKERQVNLCEHAYRDAPPRLCQPCAAGRGEGPALAGWGLSTLGTNRAGPPSAVARARSRASTSMIDVRSWPGRPFTDPGKDDGRERSDFSIAAFQIAGRDLPCLCNRYVRRWRLFSRGGPVYPFAFVRRGLAHVCIRAIAIKTLLPKTRVSGPSGQVGRSHGDVTVIAQKCLNSPRSRLLDGPGRCAIAQRPCLISRCPPSLQRGLATGAQSIVWCRTAWLPPSLW
jgi:hypothetical protein